MYKVGEVQGGGSLLFWHISRLITEKAEAIKVFLISTSLSISHSVSLQSQSKSVCICLSFHYNPAPYYQNKNISDMYVFKRGFAIYLTKHPQSSYLLHWAGISF